MHLRTDRLCRWLVLGVVTSLTLGQLAGQSSRGEDAGSGDERQEVVLSPLATQGPKPAPIDPPERKAVIQAVKKGVEFLLADQNKNGSWGSATRTKGLNIYAPVPGGHHAFRAATTSLAIMALVEVAESDYLDDKTGIEQSLSKADSWLREELPQLRRGDTDAIYNTWGHAYAIRALVRLHNRESATEEAKQEYIKLLKDQVDDLGRYEFVNGGWGYYDFEYRTRRPGDSPNSFVTATVLIAFDEAKELVDIPEKLVERAITSIRRQQKPDFSYAYGEYLRMVPMMTINRPGGSLGRSQACNLALRLWGSRRITDEVLETWLNRLYARNGWLSIGRKRPVPHEAHFSVAGYFYYYGHFYAAGCIELLPQDERAYFQDHLAQILLPKQEKDGSWWDYPLYAYHQPYGTSYAVLTLVRCVHD